MFPLCYSAPARSSTSSFLSAAKSKFFIEGACFRRRTAPRWQSYDTHNTDALSLRQRDEITNTDWAVRSINPPPVEAHDALLRHGLCHYAALCETRKPEELVDPHGRTMRRGCGNGR